MPATFIAPLLGRYQVLRQKCISYDQILLVDTTDALLTQCNLTLE